MSGKIQPNIKDQGIGGQNKNGQTADVVLFFLLSELFECFESIFGFAPETPKTTLNIATSFAICSKVFSTVRPCEASGIRRANFGGENSERLTGSSTPAKESNLVVTGNGRREQTAVNGEAANGVSGKHVWGGVAGEGEGCLKWRYHEYLTIPAPRRFITFLYEGRCDRGLTSLTSIPNDVVLLYIQSDSDPLVQCDKFENEAHEGTGSKCGDVG